MDLSNSTIEPSSYKDAAGFVFYSNNKVYRKVNSCFVEQYLQLKKNGVYKSLIEQGFLFPFIEMNDGNELLLESEMLKFISFPYEWSFEQMKIAALFHLDFMKACLSVNCSVKDASPYNIQFVNNKPVFIDILSLEPYIENTPWNGYRQFCEMFLAPLLLSSYFNGNWNRELMIQPEGISLQKVSYLLPLKGCFNSLALFHIIAHARAGSKNTTPASGKIELPRKKMLSIINHLRVGIIELSPEEISSNWTSYSCELPYNTDELNAKKRTVKSWIGDKQYTTVFDVGANNTSFSEIAAARSNQVILIDKDMAVIDKIVKTEGTTFKNIFPLHVDITQASPALGINLTERKSFFDRINPDLTLALALIHHLFHSGNIPLSKIAEIFSQCSSTLIIEFVSETDEMFLKIRNPNNGHPYSKLLFEKEFEKYFTIVKTAEIKQNKRFLFYMEKT